MCGSIREIGVLPCRGIAQQISPFRQAQFPPKSDYFHSPRLALLSRTFTFELAPTRSPSISVEYDYVDKQSIPTAGLSPASPTALWAAGHRLLPALGQ